MEDDIECFTLCLTYFLYATIDIIIGALVNDVTH